VRDTTNGTWNNGSLRCYNNNAGAALCTHQQLRRACAFASFAITPGAWLADRFADDTVLITNNNGDCNNFDGNAGGLTDNSSAGQYCCLEWMKY
jgi:hypothetical protein